MSSYIYSKDAGRRNKMFNEIEEFTIRCIDCDGEGIIFEPYLGCVVCKCCNGTGEVVESDEYSDDMMWTEVA